MAPGQIWCGLCPHPAPFNEHGYQVDPKTLRITPLPHGPLDDLGPEILWTGAAEISLNPGDEIIGPGVRVLPGDIAIWNPTTRRWASGPQPRGRPTTRRRCGPGPQLYVLARNGSLLAYGR